MNATGMTFNMARFPSFDMTLVENFFAENKKPTAMEKFQAWAAEHRDPIKEVRHMQSQVEAIKHLVVTKPQFFDAGMVEKLEDYTLKLAGAVGYSAYVIKRIESNEPLVYELYGEFMEELTRLHDASAELLVLAKEAEADLCDTVSPVFSSLDDMFAALDS